MKVTAAMGTDLADHVWSLEKLWHYQSKRQHRRRMNQTAKIRIKGSNYPIIRFFMWVGLASFALMFVALWRSKFTLAAVGLTLLLIARVAGNYFHRKESASQNGLRCQKCGQPVDLQQAISTAPQDDLVARCHYCGEPFGKFSN
jgi:DNA-directed RNA polymerase subunit RPC12/RpoP